MSDWGAVYAPDFATKGLDQESGEQLDKQVWFDEPLRSAVQSGSIPARRLEDMTRRILRSMFANGLFDYPSQRTDIDYAAHTEIARNEAREAIVLLRNRDSTLPLAASVSRILVVGGRANLGTLSGAGSSQVLPPHVNSRAVIPLGGEGEMAAWRSMVFQSSAPLTAIRAHAPKAIVTFDEGRYPSAAAALAKQSEVVIVFATQWASEGEDVPDLTLPDGQDELIKALVTANPHTVVVLETGGPVLMPWLNDTAAVLEAWYPGAGGAEAIADILFGNVNPSGHLPISFPTSVGPMPGAGLSLQQPFDVPHPRGAAVGYRWLDQKPLFPFGYGLSYTHFSYRNLNAVNGKSLTVSFDVHNDGGVSGKDVPQVYLVSVAGKALKRLIGFTKVELGSGATQRVSITVDPRLLADFDANKQRWHVTSGQYRIEVGPSAAQASVTTELRMPESWRKP